MFQPKEPQLEINAESDDRVAVALQQYNDTKGHFSLVRSVWALVFPLIPRADGQPKKFSPS
jgi:hypothetical protein